MSEQLPTHYKDNDPLNLAGAERAAEVAWAQEQISQACFVPKLPPKAWAGRDEIIAGVAEQFGVKLVDAASVVDEASLLLCGHELDDQAPALKRTMLVRLIGIRKLILKAIGDGRRESQYKTDPDPNNPNKRIKFLFKEKHYHGIDMAAIGRLLEVERAIADLQGLKGPEEAVATLSVLDELNDAMDATAKRKVTLSLAQKIKTGQIGELSVEGKRMVSAALDEMNKEKKRLIEGEVVKPEGEPEEEEDEEKESE